MDSTTKSQPRSRTDGLTAADRKQLYDGSRYEVQEVEPGEWLVSHRDVPAVFTAKKLDRRGTLQVRSNTFNEHTVDYHNQGCTCEDSKERARVEERPCKHLAVAEAVAHFCDQRRLQREEEREAMIELKFERRRRALEAELAQLAAEGRVLSQELAA